MRSIFTMKKISLIFLIASFMHAHCQDMSKKLMNRTWYATGDILKSEKVILHASSPTSKPEIKFLEDNNLQLKTDTLSDFNFVCLYKLKKDMVKIYYTEKTESLKGPVTEKEIAHYYKIRAIQNSSDFELTPLEPGSFK